MKIEPKRLLPLFLLVGCCPMSSYETRDALRWKPQTASAWLASADITLSQCRSEATESCSAQLVRECASPTTDFVERTGEPVAPERKKALCAEVQRVADGGPDNDSVVSEMCPAEDRVEACMKAQGFEQKTVKEGYCTPMRMF